MHHIAAKDKQKAPKLESGEYTGLASAGHFYILDTIVETKAERGEKKLKSISGEAFPIFAEPAHPNSPEQLREMRLVKQSTHARGVIKILPTFLSDQSLIIVYPYLTH